MSSITKTHGESFAIPANVTNTRLTLRGEPGGDTPDSTGGEGAIVVGELAVTDTDTLYFRGSATGGSGNSDGGDGGDAIDVRLNGTTLTEQVAVAAGGGGGGRDIDLSTGQPGGDGGADTGEDGETASDGGKGGTQSAGGAAGGGTATAGARFQGGDGGTDTSTEFGGGGGSGFYGGGGGREEGGNGGGGGSNYDDDLQNVTTNQRGGWTSSPEVLVEYAAEPAGVAIDALTETAEGEVTIDASATQGYDPDSTWTLYRSTDGSQGTQIHTETGNGDLNYVDSAAPTGDVVFYTAELSNISGSDSAQQSTIVRAAAVTNLTVTGHDAASVTLDWDDNPGPDVDQYEIYRAEASGASFVDYTQIDTSATSDYTNSGLENGERYYYTVLATNSGDASYDSRYPGEVDQITDLPAPSIDSTEDTA